MLPRVSVVMPCFNSERYVGEAIRSVLASTEENLELIVIEDGSTDGSRALIEEAAAKDERVRPLYHKTNLGISVSRNDGLKRAEGEYIAFCDADDLWLPTKLENQIQLLRQYPAADLAYGNSKIIDETGKETGALFSDRFPVPGNGNGNLFPALCVRNFINTQTVLLRRSILKEENLFNPRIDYGEDWLLWTTLARTSEFVYTPEILGFYRMHEANSTSDKSEKRTRNRVLVFIEFLRFPDLPRKILAQVFYHMGVALTSIKDSGDLFSYKQSLMYNPFNLKALARLILCARRK